MVADIILSLIGGNSLEFSNPEDKWAEVLYILSGPGSYVIAVIVFLLPFGYLAIRRKPFNKKNIIICIIIGAIIAVTIKLLIDWGLLALVGLSLQQLYGI